MLACVGSETERDGGHLFASVAVIPLAEKDVRT